MKPTLKVIRDFTKDVNTILSSLRSDQVLVGIPEKTTDRNEDAVSNAQILAVNHYGSSVQNIPPRPVLAIGIRKAQRDIADAFRKAAADALSKGARAVTVAYNRAGIIASTSVKKVINAQEGIAPPAPSTLAARAARGFKGTKALLVTGQLRNAITYVVKGEE